MAYEFMKNNQTLYPITKMAVLFGVSRGTYYKWLKNGTAQKRSGEDAEVLFLIRQIVTKHCRRYGSPRVRRELRTVYGKRVSRKKVARLMRENGLNARRKRKTSVSTTNSNHQFPVCPNILNRDFHASLPGEKWVSDITYLRTKTGFIYLTVVMDLYDRKIIGWALSEGMETSHTTIPAFMMALKTRPPHSGLIFHSDRGVQYCAYSFRDTLQTYCPSLRQSMSRTGNCWDNACAESFFKTLKVELETVDGNYAQGEVRQSIFMFIETYYNRIRSHSALDYLAPNEYTLLQAA
jgi:transposase InsO family protein